MRILHISSQQPDQTGSGIYIQEIMAQAQNYGYENGLAASLPKNKLPPQNLASSENFFLRFETDTLHFTMPGMSDIMPYQSTIFGTMARAEMQIYIEHLKCHLERAIRQFQPDIIHSNHLWIASSLTRHIAPNIPMVVSCHGSDLRQLSNCPHLRKIVLDGCQKVDHVFALSKEQKETISSLYDIEEDKIEIVGSGVKATLFTAPRVSRPHKKPLRMLYAGKLSKAKGVPYLLKALEGLNKDVHLTIAGDGVGAEAIYCHKLITQMEGQVEYIGKISQNELAQQMQNSDIFILPSLFEGMPLVVLEALSCGCQVLATSLPGVLEIAEKTSTPALHSIAMPKVHHVDKLSPEQELQFTENIQQSIHNLLQNMNQNSPKTGSVEYFHWSKVFERINKVYTRLHAKVPLSS